MSIGLKGLIQLSNRIKKLEKEHAYDCESLCAALASANENYENISAANEECTGNCPELSGPSFTVDLLSAVNTNTDFNEAPYNTGDPGSGGWIAVTYGDEAPEEQDFLTVLQTAGFLSGGDIVAYDELGGFCITAAGFSTIGDFVPGAAYQFNVTGPMVLDSSAVAGLTGEFSVENCIEDCNDEFNVVAAEELVNAASAAADAGSCQPCE